MLKTDLLGFFFLFSGRLFYPCFYNGFFNHRAIGQGFEGAHASYTSETDFSQYMLSIDTQTYGNTHNYEYADKRYRDKKWSHGDLLLQGYLHITRFRQVKYHMLGDQCSIKCTRKIQLIQIHGFFDQ